VFEKNNSESKNHWVWVFENNSDSKNHRFFHRVLWKNWQRPYKFLVDIWFFQRIENYGYHNNNNNNNNNNRVFDFLNNCAIVNFDTRPDTRHGFGAISNTRPHSGYVD
jgi:hypothetical protein